MIENQNGAESFAQEFEEYEKSLITLNTRDVVVNVYDAASYEEVIVDITRTTTSAVKVDFNVAPATGTNYKVVVIG